MITLFGCLFETGEDSHELDGAHAGVASTAEARSDKPWCLSKTECTINPNFDTFKLIIGVKVFVDLVLLFVSSIMELANPPLPVVRQGCV